ncbi:MAG: tellurite resistance/C4-dicarboxylate transporter family protein [Gemmatimonadetes bacterium]|nr:tellurite resistance/C4-dicarboxylate transporter family protein [Gemmatimonadota bacterium]
MRANGPPVTAPKDSPGTARTRLRATIEGEVRNLAPAYFGLVMATGIVSIAAHSLEMELVAAGLFWFNLAAYGTLWLVTLWRIARYPRRLFHDLIDHNVGPGFFTVVAGTCILGSQFIVIREDYPAAIALWALGIVLWIPLTYAIFTAFTVKREKPTLAEGINGAWLLAVVATQSVANLSGQLSFHFGAYKLLTNFFALSMWLWGGMLYIWMISLIFYRYTFFRFEPGDLSPPYWINMGAVAISTLTDSRLILNTPHAPFLKSILPFLEGFTIFFWATATWWIPMLAILAVWRHVYRRYPLTYHPLYWGAVFPLGMYTACTFQLGQAAPLPFLIPVAESFVYVAVSAWVLAFAGLLHTLVTTVRKGLERIRRMDFFCPFVGCPVSLEVVEGKARADHGIADIRSCTAFEGEELSCGKKCIELLRSSPMLETPRSASSGP